MKETSVNFSELISGIEKDFKKPVEIKAGIFDDLKDTTITKKYENGLVVLLNEYEDCVKVVAINNTCPSKTSVILD